MCKIIKISFLALLLSSVQLLAQEHNEKPEPTKILGKSTVEDIKKVEVHAEWFNKNYDAYTPNANIVGQLSQTKHKKISVEVFYGTWCGDTKREMPRFVKVLDAMNFEREKVSFIGVEDDEKILKQSPTGEERGKGIYRVPTFIFYENGKEIARINEFPSETLERDLLKILNKQPYQPNYAAHAVVKDWDEKGLLSDPNISAAGLANQIHYAVSSDNTLNSLGYLFMAQKKLKEAIVLLHVNANLYPAVANCYDSLGEAYAKADMKEKAISAYEYALKLDPNSKTIPTILEELKKNK